MKPKSSVPPLRKKDTILRKPKKEGNVGVEPKWKGYMLATGTPNQLNEPRPHATEAGAKLAATDFLRSYEPWCNRFNHVGLKAIAAAVKEIDAMATLISTHRRIEVLLDEHTQVRLCVELWHENPPPKGTR